MTQAEAVERAIALAGGTQEKLARECGPPVTQAHISYWLQRGRVSHNSVLRVYQVCLRLQTQTLCAPTLHQFRPDLYPPDECPALLSQQAAVP